MLPLNKSLHLGSQRTVGEVGINVRRILVRGIYRVVVALVVQKGEAEHVFSHKAIRVGSGHIVAALARVGTQILVQIVDAFKIHVRIYLYGLYQFRTTSRALTP